MACWKGHGTGALVAISRRKPTLTPLHVANIALTIPFVMGNNFVTNKQVTATTWIGVCFLWLSMGWVRVLLDCCEDYKKLAASARDATLVAAVVDSFPDNTDDDSFTAVDYNAATERDPAAT
ncbi:hypothetical protein H310_09663 [Aphanomyces invadans]|uniref:Uncharacterized protein n=1 Tax=Aphanomyces invadans TaxID=157072 RepID=A0A024TT54_9STRA|nr:hypothetical protein H310_09663 [Aphanomyces invadans]ETV97320.1 hypothetical protein H310_09663 [Aphanomyces invadans]|eukprot:XP_008874028.1 hypothetical protein H310_09663 [Aphanomyces invadans]